MSTIDSEDLYMDLDVDLGTLISTLASFGERSYQTKNQVTGYIEKDPEDALKTLKHFNYVEELEDGWKLEEDSRVRRDATRINRLVSHNYDGHAPSFSENVFDEIKVLDSITESFDFSKYID